MSILRPALLLTLASTVCATARAQTPADPFTREVTTPLNGTRVESPEAPFRGEVLAAGAPALEKRANGVTQMTVPIGTTRPITCLFNATPIDAGVSARTVLQAFAKGFKLGQVRVTEVKAFVGSPAIYFEGDYTHRGQPGRLKLMVHADPALPKTCYHEETGYAGTFQRVTESLSRGLTSTAAPRPPPTFSAVYQMRTGKQVFGFEFNSLFTTPTGTRVETSITQVAAAASGELQFDDVNMVEQADKKGALVSKSYDRRINAKVTANMKLSRERDGRYQLEDLLPGAANPRRPLSGRLVGDASMAQRVRDGVIKGGKAVELAMWIPTVDPVAATRVVVHPKPGADKRDVTVDLGPTNMNVKLDVHGFFERIEVPSGDSAVVEERIAETGKP